MSQELAYFNPIHNCKKYQGVEHEVQGCLTSSWTRPSGEILDTPASEARATAWGWRGGAAQGGCLYVHCL